MKKIISLLVLLSVILVVVSCNSSSDSISTSSSDSELTPEEQLLFDALLVASNSFVNPSEMRILGVGDSRNMISNTQGIGTQGYQCLKVRLKGAHESGNIANDYYLLYLHRLEGRLLATQIIESKALKDWNCTPSEYPKADFSTYDAYKEFLTELYFESRIFQSEAEKAEAIERDARQDWDSTSSNEYPHSNYTTFDEYLEFFSSSFEDLYYVVENCDKEIPPSKDQNFGKLITNAGTCIVISAEGTYDISKINKALDEYWAKD